MEEDHDSHDSQAYVARDLEIVGTGEIYVCDRAEIFLVPGIDRYLAEYPGKVAEIAYITAGDRRGEGIATGIVGKLADYANQNDIHCLLAEAISNENKASLGIMKKLGEMYHTEVHFLENKEETDTWALLFLKGE